jgi:hypothetical protein
MTLTTPNLCHGVMLSSEVFVTIRSCEPSTSLEVAALGLTLRRSCWLSLTTSHFSEVLVLFPKVLIGDYEGSGPLEESAQVRLVKSIARVTCCLLVVKLEEPVTFAGFVPAVMNDDPSIPLPGQTFTVAGYGSDVVPLYRIPPLNQTEWPGPALEGSMSATDGPICHAAFSLPPGSDFAFFCGTPRPDAFSSAPCYGTS